MSAVKPDRAEEVPARSQQYHRGFEFHPNLHACDPPNSRLGKSADPSLLLEMLYCKRRQTWKRLLPRSSQYSKSGSRREFRRLSASPLRHLPTRELETSGGLFPSRKMPWIDLKPFPLRG